MDRFDTYTPAPVRVIFTAEMGFTQDATEAHRAIPLVREYTPEAKAPVIPRGALRQPAKPRVERPAVEAGPVRVKAKVEKVDRERVAALYRDGASVSDIATACKISLSAACVAMKSAGMTLRRPEPAPKLPSAVKPLDEDTIAVIVARRIAGESYLAISDALGYRRERIRLMLWRASLTNLELAKALGTRLQPSNGQSRRGDRCVKGHDLTPDNVMLRKSGDGRTYRRCKACFKVSDAAAKRKKHAKRRAELGLRPRKIADEVVSRIQEMASRGAKTKAIATELGLSVCTVSRRIRAGYRLTEGEQLAFRELEECA